MVAVIRMVTGVEEKGDFWTILIFFCSFSSQSMNKSLVPGHFGDHFSTMAIDHGARNAAWLNSLS